MTTDIALQVNALRLEAERLRAERVQLLQEIEDVVADLARITGRPVDDGYDQALIARMRHELALPLG